MGGRLVCSSAGCRRRLSRCLHFLPQTCSGALFGLRPFRCRPQLLPQLLDLLPRLLCALPAALRLGLQGVHQRQPALGLGQLAPQGADLGLCRLGAADRRLGALLSHLDLQQGPRAGTAGVEGR